MKVFDLGRVVGTGMPDQDGPDGSILVKTNNPVSGTDWSENLEIKTVSATNLDIGNFRLTNRANGNVCLQFLGE